MKEVMANVFRFVTFRSRSEDFEKWDWRHFVVGFTGTWAVGIARNWDYPSAPFFATLGLASIAYIFILSLVLFVFAWPVSSTKRNYWHVLTMVSLTSFPGLIYGIPVEQFLDGGLAQQANLWFLIVVASWRVGLAIFYFIRGADCSLLTALATLGTPIFAIILSLIGTGRAGYVMEIMGGMNRDSSGPQYQVDSAIAMLGCFSYILSLPAFVVYIVAVIMNQKPRLPDNSIRKK